MLHQKDFGSEATRTVSLARMKCVQNTEEQRVVVSDPKIWKKVGEKIQRIQQVRRCPTFIDLPVQQTQEQRVKVQRVIHSQERLQQTQWSAVYQTLHWSLKDSGKQVKIAERLTTGHRDTPECMSEVSNTQVHFIVMNSQKAPQIVEVSQQQYTGMNVDVLVIWRHTDGAGSRTGPSLM